jgi:S-DNA-T family DNA segregation ATPase FtsK/SpoIIIE
MCTYSPQDAAWSTSGLANGGRAQLGGACGAWLADACYFGFGIPSGGRCWRRCSPGALAARWMRGETLEGHAWRDNLTFWGGLLLLLAASTALEWTRLYRLETHLPGHAGGVLGYLLGKAGVGWLGFTGSGLLGICCCAGRAWCSAFPGARWPSPGARLDGLVHRPQRREKAKDVAVGRKAARERGKCWTTCTGAEEACQPKPVQIIEPVLHRRWCPERVVKERQKPCSPRCPTASCRRWTCWTPRRRRKPCPPRRWR